MAQTISIKLRVMVMQYEYNQVKDIWYSPFNPNILYCATKSSPDMDDLQHTTVRVQAGIEKIDLREGICKTYKMNPLNRLIKLLIQGT